MAKMDPSYMGKQAKWEENKQKANGEECGRGFYSFSWGSYIIRVRRASGVRVAAS